MIGLLFGRVGAWRTHLLWRGVGLAVIAGFIHDYHWPLREEFRSVPLRWDIYRQFLPARAAVEHVFSWSGVLLALFGARPAILLLAAAAAAGSQWENATNPVLFPSAELPLFVFLPLFTMVAVGVERLRTATGPSADLRALHARALAEDDANCAVFRSAMLTTLFFAAFHKLNADFFDPETSCVSLVAGWFPTYWGPWGAPFEALASPLFTVVCEAAIPVLLLVSPSLGIVATSLFFLPLGLVNATRIALIMMVMSWSFLAHADGAVLRSRRGLLAVAATVTCAAAVAASLYVYPARDLSRELIAMIEIVALTSSLAGLVVFTARLRQRFAAPASGPGPTSAPAETSPRRRSVRAAVVAATLVFLLNGAAPYLGLKYNYSISMWSNLRVDAERWNSYLVPQWVQVWPMLEHYVRVDRVEAMPVAQPLLPPGPIEAQRFRHGMAGLRRRGDVRVSIDFSHAGREYSSPDAFSDAAILEFLDRPALPPEEQAPVTIRHAETRVIAVYDRPYAKRLEPALFSETGFRRICEREARHGWTMNLAFHYRGRDYSFENATADPAFGAFLRRLPLNNLLPAKLDLGGSQRCMH